MNAPDLHVHSSYSTYDGMGDPRQIVERAKELGWGAVAITDHGHMLSAPSFYKAARAEGLNPILGCELYVSADHLLIDGDKTVQAGRRHLTVLALSYEGYANLVKWCSVSMERPLYYGGPRISIEKMAETAPFGLHHNVVLSGCLGSCCSQAVLDGVHPVAIKGYLAGMADIFPNFYVEIQDHRVPKYSGNGFNSYDSMCDAQDTVNTQLIQFAQELGLPLIVTNDSHYQSATQRKSHLAMMARKQWRSKDEAHRSKATDSVAAEFAEQYVYFTSHMRSMEKIADRFDPWVAKQSIESALEIANEANIKLSPLDSFKYALPKSLHKDPVKEIKLRSKKRLKLMVQRHGQEAQDRFDYELGAMKEFAHYLLIYSDIAKAAREQGIYTWTRGSACASLVNFTLGVHQIDPMHYGLLFERFVNPARAKFPDVDIDIESHRRDDVARMAKEMMAEIGQEVLPICTYTKASNRAAFRIAAEAAGVPKEKIEELAKLLPQMIDSGMVSNEEDAYTMLMEELGIDIHQQASQMFDAISGVSQHACGFIIGTKRRPLSSWVPTYRIGSSDAVVTQYDMKNLEAMGFLKLDLLKLDTLSIMHSIARQLGHGLDWLDQVGQSEPGIYDEPDEQTFDLLRDGRTDGVFSFQGATQRRGCIEISPGSTQDLVAIQALYRPSGTRTGLSKQFVDRHHGREGWKSLNSFTEKRWAETYDLPIYQEQIMEMGFDLGMNGAEVDDLYRAIKMAKGVGRGAAEAFEEFKPTFYKYALKCFSKQDADEIWKRWDALQGYCVTGDTVVEKGDGSTATVGELHSIWHGPITPVRKKYRSKHPKKGLWLTAWVDGAIKLDKCIDIIDNGVKDVWLVRLRDGKQLTATANHPLLTKQGWREVRDLEAGMQVCIDTYEIEPYYQSSGLGQTWQADAPRVISRDGRKRPQLHGHHSALTAVTEVLEEKCYFCGAEGVKFERAHLNHDRTDNSPENVKNACNPCHKKHDYATGQRKGRWSRGRIAGYSEVAAIEYVGKERTYDLAMQGDDHNFVANGIVAHNTFNKAHATSFAVLGKKSASLLAHYPQESFIALLERYPDNPRYVAAAIAAGFTFEPPDINGSNVGFSRGSGKRTIRTGLLRIRGVGPGAASEIVKGQPFSSLDDLRERTNSQRVKAPTIEALAAVGALKAFGVASSADDETQLNLLSMVLQKPKAFDRYEAEPYIGRKSDYSSWQFLGLADSVTPTEGKSFCAKLFWIPPNPEFHTKTSATGNWKAHLLTVVDTNGIPFDLVVSESKDTESKLIKLLSKMGDTVICVEGQIVMPFLRGGNTGFRLWGVAEAEKGNPQIWGFTQKDASKVIALAHEKRDNAKRRGRA